MNGCSSADELKPTIGIRGQNINIILPADISDEKFEYCIDKAFESVQMCSPKITKEETITYYDEVAGKAITYKLTEYYWNVIAPQKQEREVAQENETPL